MAIIPGNNLAAAAIDIKVGQHKPSQDADNCHVLDYCQFTLTAQRQTELQHVEPGN